MYRRRISCFDAVCGSNSQIVVFGCMRMWPAAIRSTSLIEGLNRPKFGYCLPRDRRFALWNAWILIPFTAAKETPAGLWPDPAPLFEEECDLGGATLVADFDRPFFGHRSRPGAAFAAYNSP